MVHPDTGDESDLQKLLSDLIKVGIEQFVVPHTSLLEASQFLAKSECEVGFVLTQSEWLSGSWQLADLPTAILLDRWSVDPEALWAALKAESRKHPSQKYVLVAPKDISVEGRPLSQVASQHAPFSQEAFHSFANFSAS